MTSHLDLWDYRRRLAALYAEVRDGGGGERTWLRWCIQTGGYAHWPRRTPPSTSP